MTTHAQLAGLAVQVLGPGRATELRDALAERGRQIALVESADLGPESPDAEVRASSNDLRLLPPPPRWSSVDDCLDRIAARDGSLHAWASVDRAAAGAGPVVGVKDVVDVAGLPTGAGVAGDGRVAAADAPAVARLRLTGVVVLGKTAPTPWALNDPAPTVNPWNPAHTPGGSSAGSAVAVATGMCDATIDTQTAGDVVRPAAFNGVVGLEPTLGWAPTAGTVPVAWSIDTLGVMGRTVAAVAAVHGLVAPAVTAAGAPVAHGLRAGTRDDEWRPALALVRDPLIATAARTVDGAAGLLAARGATVEAVDSPVDLATVHAAHRIVTFAECATFHRRLSCRPGDGRRYPPKARALIDLGLVTPATAYVAAQRLRAAATRRLAAVFGQHDVAVLPTAVSGPPADRTTTGDSSLQIPWTFCGYPALSLPTGLDEAGLPTALQLVGPPGGDRTVLAVAAWCEEVLGAAPAPPGR
jgi:Asp-tRNA(Asn)/Glu-tRNA(Gln) amidotransferase A subunit family amidase